MSRSGMTLGEFLREQRALARLSLRELSRLTHVSNAYLSQIERGVHAPSLRVLRAVADALEVPVEDLVNLDEGDVKPTASVTPACDVETAIKRDPELSERHKQALLALYLSCVRRDT